MIVEHINAIPISGIANADNVVGDQRWEKEKPLGFRKQALWERLRTICNYLGWMFSLRQLRKKEKKKKPKTWRVPILVSYAEYLAWVAHASEFLVAKPASYLMSYGCLGHVFQSGIAPWNKILEAQMQLMWPLCLLPEHDWDSGFQTLGGGLSGHILWSLAECSI